MIGKRKSVCVCVYNGILLSHKKIWNTTICDNMDGHWEYHAKWNKSGRKIQESYDFTVNVEYKTESNKWTIKTNKNL